MAGERDPSMPRCLPGDDGVRWRCLDSLAWALASLGVCLYLPSVGRTVLGGLSLLYMVPVLWALASVLRLGEPAGLMGPWQIWRLRASWTAVAGLGPFFTWWLRCADNAYLASVAAVALVAAGWALLETAYVLAQVARSRGLRTLALDTLGVRIGLLYLLVIPVLSLWVTFVAALVIGWASAPGDWLRFWRQVPMWGRVLLLYGPLLALGNLSRLLLRTSGCIHRLLVSGPSSPGEAKHEFTRPL